MDLKELNDYYHKIKYSEDIFHNLMQKKVSEILLVSTFYDAYIFEQDGRLSDQIYGEYRQLNLSTAPRIISVPTGERALEMLKKKRYDLVITMMRIGEISPFDLSKKIKELYPDLPILLLLNGSHDIGLLDKENYDLENIDNVFSWHGDSKIFLTMVKYIEDFWNVENDTEKGSVRVILLVEDSIHYYSMFHSLLYEEILKQTQKLIDEELDDISKRRRMRGRPKVLLCHNYESAIELYEKYRKYIIAVISDISYQKDGREDPVAGLKLIRDLRNRDADCPILLQSSELENRSEAEKLKVHFLHKTSKRLLHDLRDFILKNSGFGPFIFRFEDGREITRINTVEEFVSVLENIPDESLLYHSSQNSFSAWLTAHGEFLFAKRIHDLKISDFDSTKQIRELLIALFKEVRFTKYRGKVIQYFPGSLHIEEEIIRLAEGSLGGKGRGLAFMNSLFAAMDFTQKYDNITVKIPKTAVIGTNEFDEFLERNDINIDIIHNYSDKKINHLFLQGKLSSKLEKKLRELIQNWNVPLAVRSSGLLEDSQTQPFAGVYSTYMLPNNEVDNEERLHKLQNAIKLIFASPFKKKAGKYLHSINIKTEEEKMAVIIQEIVGSIYDEIFFLPEVSGVCQSYNFYPIKGMKHEDGITSLVVGLGKEVVDGGLSFRFCPRYPKIDLQKPVETVKYNQKGFYAVDLKNKDIDLCSGEEATLKKISLSQDKLENMFRELTSVWDYHNLRFDDKSFTKGSRILTFRNIIHYNQIPLADILTRLMEIGKLSLGVPVEIEFALNLSTPGHPSFYLLQIRPLSVNQEKVELDLTKIDKQDICLFSRQAIGNGQIEGVKDIVLIDPATFDNTKTVEMAKEIEALNRKMQKEKKYYVLLGPGRWGSSDRFLGIPVRWEQIDRAKVIVETSLDNFTVEASQGSHFFHNLVTMNIIYVSVPTDSTKNFIDWEWLNQQKIITRKNYTIHLEIEKPLTIKIDGHSATSVILK